MRRFAGVNCLDLSTLRNLHRESEVTGSAGEPDDRSPIKNRNDSSKKCVDERSIAKNIFVFLTLLYICLFSLATPKVYASEFNLSVTPPLLRVHIKPGKSITQVFTLENLSQSDQTLVARIVPFTEADDKGNPVLNPKATAPWLSYFGLANSTIKLNEPFTIQAGAKEQLILSLAIPDNASLEDIYATLMISTYTNNVDQSYQGTTVLATIGSNMLITISSQAYPDTVLKIVNFSPQADILAKIGNLYFADSITPLTFTADVSNEGNFAAETKGIFRITRGNTPVYLEGILPVNVIGKSSRQLLNTDGESFRFTPSLSQIGPHQITLEIKTDNSNTSNSFTVFFFPFKLSLGLIIAIFIIIISVKITAVPSKKQSGSTIDNPIQQ